MIATVEETHTRKARRPSFTDSSDTADNWPALKHRMDQDWFLFLPGLLPADDVLEVRATMLEVLVQAGWIDPAYPVDDAIPVMEKFCFEPENPS
tara:strand:+ start:31 stop:312 length:282 start_codon:yes stop_codon:yes gene_type:complete